MDEKMKNKMDDMEMDKVSGGLNKMEDMEIDKVSGELKIVPLKTIKDMCRPIPTPAAPQKPTIDPEEVRRQQREDMKKLNNGFGIPNFDQDFH